MVQAASKRADRGGLGVMDLATTRSGRRDSMFRSEGCRSCSGRISRGRSSLGAVRGVLVSPSSHRRSLGLTIGSWRKYNSTLRRPWLPEGDVPIYSVVTEGFQDIYGYIVCTNMQAVLWIGKVKLFGKLSVRIGFHDDINAKTTATASSIR